MAPIDMNDVIDDVVALVQREMHEPPRARFSLDLGAATAAGASATGSSCSR